MQCEKGRPAGYTAAWVPPMGGCSASENLYLAVDLGTSRIKAGVYSLDGRQWAAFSEPVQAECPEPGVYRQPGEMLYRAALACIGRASESLGERARQIRAAAFTGQMAGCIGVGPGWEDITGWSCSLDSRYLPWAERIRRQHGPRQYEVSGTGAPVLCAKYLWFRDTFPEEHRRIAKYVMLNGYLIGKLSGLPVEEAKIDTTLIAWTGLADIRKGQWSGELVRSLGIDSALLPEIVESGKIGGYLSGEAAAQTGLLPGIPLILGAGDKVSGCIGAGVSREGDLIFEAASYGAVSCQVKDVRLDREAQRYDLIGAADREGYFAHKYLQGSGIALDWFVQEFLCAPGESREAAFARAEAAGDRLPAGSGKLLAIGLLSGSAIPFDGEMRGLFLGYTLSHTKTHFYHALLESFCYDLALTLESLDRAYPEYAGRDIRLIGGGARSALWSQMLADVTGRCFEWVDREDAALWGTALLAAAGAGELLDVAETAGAQTGIRKVYYPRQERHRAYLPYIRLYESAVSGLHGLFRDLNRL